MLREGTEFKHFYIACGHTDMRYGLDGFESIFQTYYCLNPFDAGTLFLFCGRRSDCIKGLLWEEDGFLLLYKRLSDGKFQWRVAVEKMKLMDE